jgi:hypothetical protein
MNFDPCNRPLKIWESIGTRTPEWELIWECEGSFPHIFLHSQEHEMWLPGFTLSPQTLQALALVASPRLRLREWVRCCNKKKTRNHGHRYIFKLRYLHSRSPSILCGYKQNKTMIGMLRGWRIGRISMMKKIRFLKQGLFPCLWWVGNHWCSMSCWNF